LKKRVPYGESNFKRVMEDNMYYIDKTKHIEILESMPSFQFFIRPRRFGKSLFLSMLETYYDVYEEQRFDEYFGEFYIGKNKTKEANKYLTLRISFAGIVSDQGKEELIKSFDNIVNNTTLTMLRKYKSIMNCNENEIKGKNAIETLNKLNNLLKENNKKMILLIDEYDNFTNGLMIKDKEMYKTLVQTDGYVKTFYKEIKEGTAEGSIPRVFITGVSPILLDDLTSGANIFENLTNEYKLNDMMGVRQEELEKMIDYYEFEKYVDKKELLEMMKELYNGYKFNSKTKETVYNTGMTMYIVNKIKQNEDYPDDMLDDNIKTDYGKLRTLAQSFESKDELREIVEENKLIGPIELKKRFGIDTMYEVNNTDNFYSLLYYLGLVTIKKTEGRKIYLGIPNYSVKTMYWEYLLNSYKIANIAKMQEVALAMNKMRRNADVKEIMEIYARVRSELSNRDLIWYNEMTSKSIFITLLFLDGVYILESEKEVRAGYTDLYLKEGVTYKEEVNYRYLLEFKHIKQEDYTEKALTSKKKEAKEQLEKYIKDAKIQEDGVRPLKKMIVISIGKNDTIYEELN